MPRPRKQQNGAQQAKQAPRNFLHVAGHLESPFPLLAGSTGEAWIADAETAAFFPRRYSSPVSRSARIKAGQSSKSVANTFSTMRRVRSGTIRFRASGGVPL